jgi:hypothetical protein
MQVPARAEGSGHERITKRGQEMSAFNDSSPLVLYVGTELKERLREVSWEVRESMSELARRAIEQFLSQHETAK